ncbi:uncharacterized protein LOC133930213 [Phragmites australis]|uniref:uncharacterized protein LOC133930213 n=1 Tax=Phragmites australis TaxID=29695 RepID=UPI002D774DF7|nr:uncharacterized protein LOC133930213 [Phragmites australis]
MLCLRKCILPHLLSLRHPSPTSLHPLMSLHRLLSATGNPFAAEDYLVANCGLSKAQAVKASKMISHLKSPSKPDAVLAFLTGLGLSHADIATVVSNDPLLLCADVEKSLAPRIVELSDLRLSRPEIARLVLTARNHLRSSSLRRNVDFWLQVFGSLDELLHVLKVSNGLLGMDHEKVVSNLALLQGCGIRVPEIPKAFMCRMVTVSTKHLQEALARVDEFGIEQNSSVFPHALSTFAILSREKLTKNMQLFEKLGWSREDISLAVRKFPNILGSTEKRVRRSLEFLMGDVGLEIPYIARRPALMLYSIERRLLPRHCLMNFLKAKGLLNAEFSFYFVSTMGNEKFLHRFVHPYEDSVPGLAAAFASCCAGKHQWEQLCETDRGKEKVLTPKICGDASVVYFLSLLVTDDSRLLEVFAALSPLFLYSELYLLKSDTPSLRRRSGRHRRNAMLQLRNLLSLIHPASPLPVACLPPLLALHRLLSTAAAAPFAVDDYLVSTCGLTRAQALKASKKLSHLRSPSRPDAVLAFLSAQGLSRANIAAVVAADPRLLCADVENNLDKRVATLRDFGLSRSQIARLIMVSRFRSGTLRRNLTFWLPVLGSIDKLLQVVKLNVTILSVDPEKASKPNLALLQQCGINVSDFPTFMSRVLTRPHKVVQEAVTQIDKIGVPRSSRMFYYALMAFAIPNEKKLANKFGILEMYGWSQEDVLIAVRKMPGIVTMSDDRLRRNVEFLTRNVGLETHYIAQRPVLIKYSLERRLLPRHCLLKVLKAKGLLDAELDFYFVASLTEKKFHNKFIGPYEERVPGLAHIYASSCDGKVPN